MAVSKRNVDKFTCKLSRFVLPTFRRPCYRQAITTHTELDPESKVFRKWSEQEGKFYSIINTALLNDNIEILQNNVQFINSLKMGIRNNHMRESFKVYRGLQIDPRHVQEQYKVGLQFLWPTFTATSKSFDQAHHFGNHVFEIHASNNDFTYRADISKYSAFPEEQEILFYPYSGYMVTNIIPDAKIIQLKCIDTLEVESSADKRIPSRVKIFDRSRNMYVYFYKDSTDVHWSKADKPNEMFLIGENPNGYWDAPYRYHHSNGYFVDKGNNVWEEYQGSCEQLDLTKQKLCATFRRVDDGAN